MCQWGEYKERRYGNERLLVRRMKWSKKMGSGFEVEWQMLGWAGVRRKRWHGL